MALIKQLGISAIASGIVLVPVYFFLWKFSVLHRRQAVTGFLFSLYLCVVFSVVGLPSLAYWKYLRWDVNLNLIPLLGIPADLHNALLNVVLFVPLGIMLPLFRKKYRSVAAVGITGFCLSLLIELLQMFTYRATDIDDLLTNTLGTLIGYGIAKCILKKHDRFADSEGTVFQFFFITCIVMFFIQPYIASAMELHFL